MNASWATCRNHMRGFAQFPSREPERSQIFAPHFANIRSIRWQCSKGSMDLRDAYGYRFDNAWMTESLRGTGAIAVARLEGLGEGTKLRFVRSLRVRGWALIGATALCLALPGAITTLGNSAQAGATLEERKLPMHFNWVACQPDCKGWVSRRRHRHRGQSEGVRGVRARIASSAAPPSCWIPAAVRSTIPSRSAAASAASVR